MAIDVKKLVNTYEFESKLTGSDKVIKFKPITTGIMKKILVYENEENIETLDNFLDDLISNCVTTENFNIDELYLQDRFSLLVDIRRKSKGDIFKFNYTCPKCKMESIIAVKLSELPVLPKKEKFDPVIINDNLSVYLRHLTRADQKKAFAAIPDTFTLNKRLAEIATYSYALAIEKVVSGQEEDSNVSIEDKIFLLDSLDQDVYDKLSNWFNDNNFGIDFTYKFKCKDPNCKSEEKVINIPITNFFA